MPKVSPRLLVRLRKSLKHLELRPAPVVERRSAEPEWYAMLQRIEREERERRLAAAEAALNRLN